MKGSFKKALLGIVAPVIVAALPLTVAPSMSAPVASTEAVCMDCTMSVRHICGGPDGAEGYCTSGSEWCKEDEETLQ